MPELTDKQFIEAVYELAFGHDAINRNFGHAEVIEQLEEFNEDSLKWDSIPAVSYTHLTLPTILLV